MFVRNLIVLRSSLILSLGLTPGTIRCLMTGTEASMAPCTCLIQASVALSTCSGVSGSVVSGWRCALTFCGVQDFLPGQ